MNTSFTLELFTEIPVFSYHRCCFRPRSHALSLRVRRLLRNRLDLRAARIFVAWLPIFVPSADYRALALTRCLPRLRKSIDVLKKNFISVIIFFRWCWINGFCLTAFVHFCVSVPEHS